MPDFDVIVIAPNSAIDSYYSLPGLQRGGVNLSRTTTHTAGGKGFNLCRALSNLGGRPLGLGVAGGQAGAFIERELEREGISHRLVWGESESRRCNTLHIDGDCDTTVLLESGAFMGQAVVPTFTACILAHASAAPYLVMTGSLLPDFPLSFYAEMVRQLKNFPVKTGVDCSGPALRLAAEAGANLVKINRIEFTSAFLPPDQPFSWTVVEPVFERLSRLGVEILVVTDGSQGAYLFSQGQPVIHVVTPVEKLVSTAGSGDSFFAGLLLGLQRDKGLESAARLASAAAAANLQNLGCGVFELETVQAFLEVTQVYRLDGGGA